MKALICSSIILAISIISLNASACSCGEYPLAQDSVLENFIASEFGAQISEEDITPLKYYPTYRERLIGFDNGSTSSSCIGESFDGKKMFYCSRSRKYLYEVNLRDRNCSLKIRVKTTIKKSKIKVLSSTCK